MLKWLESIDTDLQTLEADAAPSGWKCIWNRYAADFTIHLNATHLLNHFTHLKTRPKQPSQILTLFLYTLHTTQHSQPTRSSDLLFLYSRYQSVQMCRINFRSRHLFSKCDCVTLNQYTHTLAHTHISLVVFRVSLFSVFFWLSNVLRWHISTTCVGTKHYLEGTNS